MCTVSWVREDGGYQLLCNRDELASRAPALGPRIAERDGIRCAAPVDGDFGGTWIGANECGVTVCLLNGAPGRALPSLPSRNSRGLLVSALLSARCQGEVMDRIGRTELCQFAPFTLAILEPGLPAAAVTWDGSETAVLAGADRHLPLVSSSFDQAGVRLARKQEFFRRLAGAGKPDAAALAAFHASHTPGPSAYSPCMHRPGAETVSFTRVRVTPSEVTVDYTPAAPCRSLPVERVTLPCRF